MTRDRAYPEIAKNYVSIAGHFAVFGVFVTVFRALGLQDANAYLIAMPSFAAASVAFNRLKPALTRGFTPLCVAFVACTLAFPAVDRFVLPQSDLVLYGGAIGMAVFFCILCWRAVAHRRVYD